MSSLLLPFPPYLDHGGAYFDEIVVNQVVGSSVRTIVTVPGDWWLLLKTVSFTLTVTGADATGATGAAARWVPALALYDQNGVVVLTIPQPAGQGTNTTVTYLWTTDTSTAYGSGNNTQVAPCYSGYIPAGYTVRLFVLNGKIPDQWTGIAAIVTKIPTIKSSGDTPAEIPTPLLV